MISSPIQKKNNTNSIPYSQSPASNLSEPQKLIQSEAKKLIFSKGFITLLEDITSVVEQQGFQVQSLVNKLNGKDGPFRVLTTRLQLAKELNDPVFKKIASYLSTDLLSLNKEDTIKIVHLGDQRFYQDKLGRLTGEQIKTLKEKLLEAFNDLKILVQNQSLCSETLNSSQTRQPKMGTSDLKQINVTQSTLFKKQAQQQTVHDQCNEALKNLELFMKNFYPEFENPLSAQYSKSFIHKSRQESNLSFAQQSVNPNVSPTRPLCTR